MTQSAARQAALAGLVACLSVAGCGPSRPARLTAPPLDPAAVADAAAAGGGIAALPAVAFGKAVLDADRDGQVSRDELVTWLGQVRDSRVAITSVTVQVTHQGRPLAAAEVKLVPEGCMGSGIAAATGKTDRTGLSTPTIPGGDPPGIHCGLYRVEITGKGNDGAPVAATYNTASMLGLAVGGTLPQNGRASFELK